MAYAAPAKGPVAQRAEVPLAAIVSDPTEAKTAAKPKRAFVNSLSRLALTSLIFLGCQAAPARAQTYLYNQASLPTGNTPSSIALADFNGDGRLDLAVTNQSDDSVSIFLSTPNGGFAAKVDYPVGTAPVQVVTSDFNGDHIIDLAVVNTQDNTVSILLGNPDGTFGAQATYPTGATPVSIVAVDLNGDNKTDLAVLNQGAGTVSLLLGNGDGTFSQHGTAPAGSTPTILASGDFNNDGKSDLIILNSGGQSVSVLLNNGDATFTATTSPALDGLTAATLVVGDFNNDEKLDVVLCAPTNGALSILLGNGDGTFQPGNSISLSIFPYSIIAGDFNNDGNLDLALQENDGPPSLISILLGKGDGTFQTGKNTGFAGGPLTTLMADGDFNNDGRLDLAAMLQNSNLVSVMLGNGDGTLANRIDLALPTPGASAGSAIADFTGDGNPDLAVAEFVQPQQSPITGLVAVFPGNGAGTFSAPKVTQTSNIGISWAVTADFNGDGIPDFATVDVDGNGGISVFLGNGDGTFGPAVVSDAGASGLNVQQIAAGDFNGDGKADLAVLSLDSSNSFSSLIIFVSNGDGTFTPGAPYDIPFAGLPYAAAADLNHDGNLDLAVADGDNAVLVFLGKGDGTLAPPVSYSAGSRSNSALSIADFNGDGILDMVVSTDLGLLFFAGKGDGTFQPPATTPASVLYVAPLAADFNGDGIPDLAVEGAPPAVSLLLNNGDGTFQPPIPFEATYFPRNFTAGDINGDGISDLVQFSSNLFTAATPAPDYASVWRSAPVTSFSASTLQFPVLNVGNSSAPQLISLANAGNAPLAISKIAITGDFSESDTCTNTMAIGQTCAFNVTFTPTANGPRVGSLVLTDNAFPRTQSLNLVGWAGPPDFSISATPSSSSVTAGASTSYTVTLSPGGGFSGTLQITCSGAPSKASCTPSQDSVTLSGSTPSKVIVTVTTTAASSTTLQWPISKAQNQSGSIFIAIALSLLALVFVRVFTVKRRAMTLAAAAACLLICASCGGGGSSGGGGGGGGGSSNPGTPSGSYTLTVTATSTSSTHSTTVTLNVN